MDVRAVRQALLRKLAAVEDRAGHHIFFYLDYRGKRYSGPKMSHSWRGDLDRQQVDWLKKPLQLTTGEFEELVSCTLSRADFFARWAERKGLD